MGNITVGIAGYMGSGKSICASYLSQYGGIVIEADTVAKELIENDRGLQEQLVTRFGNTIICNNTVDFTVLGSIAFRSMDHLVQLNAIVHPPLLTRLQNMISDADAPLCICDAALIPYWRIESWFDVLLWIYASEAIRFERILKRGEMSPDELKTRMAMQENLFQKPTGGRWIFLSNEGTVKGFTREIQRKSTIDFSSLFCSKG